MIISIFVRYVEHIPTIKDLIKYLHDDIAFKTFFWFQIVYLLRSSETSFSRLVKKLNASDILEKKLYFKLSQKVLSWMIQLPLTPPILKQVIRLHQKKEKKPESKTWV